MKLTITLAFLLPLTTSVAAQCGNVTFSSYGNTCQYFNQDATLTGQFDASACAITLTLTKSRTCCNTFPVAQVLVLGLNPISPPVSHPLLVTGCTLAVFPDLLLVQPASAGGVWAFPVAGIPAGIVVYAQGINDYFTTIGLTHDYQSSDALKIGF